MRAHYYKNSMEETITMIPVTSHQVPLLTYGAYIKDLDGDTEPNHIRVQIQLGSMTFSHNLGERGSNLKFAKT